MEKIILDENAKKWLEEHKNELPPEELESENLVSLEELAKKEAKTQSGRSYIMEIVDEENEENNYTL